MVHLQVGQVQVGQVRVGQVGVVFLGKVHLGVVVHLGKADIVLVGMLLKLIVIAIAANKTLF